MPRKGKWAVPPPRAVPLAAATPDGPISFWKAQHICYIRRVYAAQVKGGAVLSVG